uniref:Sialic acid binding Ig like lectin 1 n=1 Tax=Strigops habroptila TaxID=2489341 RepID=A0A672UEU5_STRHB
GGHHPELAGPRPTGLGALSPIPAPLSQPLASRQQEGPWQHPIVHPTEPTVSVCPPADAPKDTQVSVNPSGQNIRVGDTVSFTCEVSSSHPPVSVYRWYKDGVAMGTEQILTLRDIRREDYGQYHCEVTNDRGSDTSPATSLSVTCEYPQSLNEGLFVAGFSFDISVSKYNHFT